MTKSILLSVQPEYACKILNGEKTLEIRKSVPKGFVGWVNLYVTKGKTKLRDGSLHTNNGVYTDFNGKVVARFWFDEYDKYPHEEEIPDGYENYDGEWVDQSTYCYSVDDDDLGKMCLSWEELEKYGKGKTLYAWHIKKLEVFDKPKELKDFIKDFDDMDTDAYGREVGWYKQPIPLTKAPQSWEYIWEKERG